MWVRTSSSLGESQLFMSGIQVYRGGIEHNKGGILPDIVWARPYMFQVNVGVLSVPDEDDRDY
jgi:hypothetical protein